MVVNIISMIMLVIPPAITSESSWTSPDVRIVEEWNLNVMDLIDPAYTHLGTVYSVESEEGFEWHTVLVDQNYVLQLEGDIVVDRIPYSGDIWRMTFSPDCQYLLGYCSSDEKLILFDLAESTVKSIPLFSSGMELPGNPLIRVTNDGTILLKHYTYLRMYNSDFNCILSRDNFSWGHAFVGLSDAGDRFYTTTYDSLRAYDIQGNLMWNSELHERADEFHISRDGTYIISNNNHNLQVIKSTDCDQIARIEFEEQTSNPVFSESESLIAVGYWTHPQITPLRPINSFGVRTVSLQNGSYELTSHFQAPNSISEPGMPHSLRCHSISNSGYLLGMLAYDRPNIFARLVLLSADMKIIWLSTSISQGSFRFIDTYGKFRSDNSGFWYFDGERIHSCLIEGR